MLSSKLSHFSVKNQITFLWVFIGSKSVLYKSVKFGKKWIYSFYPPPNIMCVWKKGIFVHSVFC